MTTKVQLEDPRPGPAGKRGDASDLADAARYVQGHILAVDGGWLAR